MLDYLKKNYFINLLIIITIFSLDRISKFYVIFESERNLSSSLFTSKFLNINLIWNEGIAFGLFSFEQKVYYNLMTLLIVLITLVILWMIFKTRGFEKFAYMMIFGGSLGNIFDRIRYSSVPDFIDFHINNFHWFIFNVADIFISTGVILLISFEIFLKRKK
jgi:lipoprotein signal peptidase|tara:strand:+ start:535 stop:1020 length:486 start_codon:yes stop_codon:yes gene_type:complete